MSRFFPTFRKRRNQELDEEIQAHLAMAINDRIERGEDPRTAALAARREFGNRTLIQEVTRDMWQWSSLEGLWQDIRYALRGIRRTPGLTAVAVVSLALGIGANTAIFSLIDALMLRSLPVRDPQSLRQLKLEGQIESVSYPMVGALAGETKIFSSVGGFAGWTFNVGPAGSINKVPAAMVTGGFYRTLGLNAAAGRLLTDADDQPGAPLAAVLSHAYWSRQFDSDPGTVGREIRLNGVPVTVVGVAPAGFTGATVGSPAEITVAVAALPLLNPEAAALLGPGNFWMIALVRTAEGMSQGQAQARLAAAWPGIAPRVTPRHWPPSRQRAIETARFELKAGGTGWTFLRQLFRKPLLVLMGMVSLVLLVACANVANLLLARAAARRKEFAVRLAIGAGRGRIIRQLLVESALLASIGAAFGLLLAAYGSRILVALISRPQLPVALDLTPNLRVLAFTASVALLTGLLFGLAPALQTALRTAPALQDGGRGRGRARLLSTLVTIQVAGSMVLLVGAGLFARTLRNLDSVDAGFAREGVLLVELDGRRAAFRRELLDFAAAIPGVVAATVATHTPLSGSTWSDPAVPAGTQLPEKDTAHFVGGGPRFFQTMQTPLLAGRDFAESDTGPGPSIAVVNEAYARRFFGGLNPVGRHLSAKVRGNRVDLEIIGLARDAALSGLRATPPATVYVPYLQLTGDLPTTLALRVKGSPSQIAVAVQKELQPRLPEMPVEVVPLSRQVAASMAQERLLASLAGAFGALALSLACIGLYGLLNYSVARRTREIGIRMALGAQRRSVVGMEVGSAVRLVFIGILLGLPAAWAVSRTIHSLLFGLTPTDPATIAAAAGLLLSAALAAAYLPARRASQVDPTTALRHE